MRLPWVEQCFDLPLAGTELVTLGGCTTGGGLDTGWLVIFDQRSDLPDIGERLTTEPATTPAGRGVVVVRA